MNKLHATMVDTCDRLLLLVTGPRAADNPDRTQAALQAIEWLQILEGRLRGGTTPTAIDTADFHRFLRSEEVSHHVAEVFEVLHEQGLCHSDASVIRH